MKRTEWDVMEEEMEVARQEYPDDREMRFSLFSIIDDDRLFSRQNKETFKGSRRKDH